MVASIERPASHARVAGAISGPATWSRQTSSARSSGVSRSGQAEESTERQPASASAERVLSAADHPPIGTDMNVRLFFEADTFRHVRSEYTKVVVAQMGDRSYSANVQERESRYKLVEHFSGFKPEGALTLPHAYKIELVIDTQNGTFQGEWLLNLTGFTFNEKIAPDSFNVPAG